MYLYGISDQRSGMTRPRPTLLLLECTNRKLSTPVCPLLHFCAEIHKCCHVKQFNITQVWHAFSRDLTVLPAFMRSVHPLSPNKSNTAFFESNLAFLTFYSAW